MANKEQTLQEKFNAYKASQPDFNTWNKATQLNNFGIDLLLNDDPHNALTAFKKAQEIAPNDPLIQMNINAMDNM